VAGVREEEYTSAVWSIGPSGLNQLSDRVAGRVFRVLGRCL
jgi:hypothetical protein